MANLLSNMNIDININIIRGRCTSSNKISMKESSTHSDASSFPYHKRIEMQNKLLDEDAQELVDSFKLMH